MEDFDLLLRKFDSCCFTLSREDILKFDKADNGPINNVIAMIERHCFGAKLYDDKYGLTVEMFYINNDNSLKGDLIKLEVTDPDYFQLLLRFCTLLSNDYKDVNELDAFNTFQTRLRGFLEKRGFFTTTNLELKQFEGKNAVLMSSSERGILKLDFIDKTQFYRDFFNDIYKHEIIEGKEYVYLMHNGDSSLIKIGTSKKPGYRERTLHSKEPNIHIIALWNCQKSIEKELHKKYKHKRIRGEWFNLNLADLKEIEEYMNSSLSNCS